MAPTVAAYFKLADKKKKQPLAADNGRVYIFSSTAFGSVKNLDAWTEPFCQFLGTDKPKWYLFKDERVYSSRLDTFTLPMVDPRNGPWTHLLFFWPSDLGQDFLRKNWAEVKKRGSLIPPSLITGDPGPHVVKDGAGNYTVLVDTDPDPLGNKRCEIVRVELRDEEGKADFRQAGSENRIQVVGEPKNDVTFSIGLPFKAKIGEMKKDRYKTRNMIRSYLRSEMGFKEWCQYKADYDALKKKKADAEPSGAEWVINANVAYMGKRELYLGAKCSDPKCTGAHPLTISGGDYKANTKLKPKDKLELGWKGYENWEQLKIAPDRTTYTVSGKGCRGEPYNLQIEVFPSIQVGAGIEVSSKLWEKKFDKIKGFLKKVGGKSDGLEFKFFGSAKWLGAYAEETYDWHAYYNHALAAELGVSLGFSLTFSALQVGLGIPQCVSDCIGDLRLKIGLEGKVTVGGEVKIKAPSPFSRPVKVNGKITGKVTVGIPLELKAFIGADGVLGASIRAGITPALFGKGEAEPDSKGRWAIVLSYGAEKGEVEVVAELDVLFWKSTKKFGPWKIWGEQEFGKTDPIFLSSDAE